MFSNTGCELVIVFGVHPIVLGGWRMGVARSSRCTYSFESSDSAHSNLRHLVSQLPLIYEGRG